MLNGQEVFKGEKNKMGKESKIISTGDAGIEIAVYANNQKELFEKTAFAMFTLIAAPSNECKKQAIKLTVTANSTEGLLLAFLRELIHYFRVRKILLCGFKIMSLTEHKLHAKLTGEEIDRHKILRDIKSASYGGSKIVKTRAGYKVHILFAL